MHTQSHSERSARSIQLHQTTQIIEWDNTVRIWRANADSSVNASDLHELKGHTARVVSVSWSPDGSHLASASDDNTIRIHAVASKDVYAISSHLVQIFEGHEDSVQSLSWSPDGSRLASASVDTTVRIWQAEEFGRVDVRPQVLKGHKGSVLSVSWSPTGSFVASSAEDFTVLA